MQGPSRAGICYPVVVAVVGKIIKTLARAITAPFRWLVKAPLRLLLGVFACLALLVVLAPNLLQVFCEHAYFRTVDQLAAEVYYRDEDLLAGQTPGQNAFGTYDCIMVLGAAVRPDGRPSAILADRIQTAVELYQAGVAPKILMSGDNQSDRETYDEVYNMKRYAVEELGVPSEDVFCDHAGINTYDSAYRLYHVFGAKRAVVVTQSYHLYRALFDVRSFRVDAVGVPSDLHTYDNQLFYDLRECAARVSDAYKVLSRADATYLSEPVPLDQSGDVTSWQY